MHNHFAASQSVGAAGGLAAAREDLERELGQNLPEPIWDFLIREKHVEDYLVVRGRLRDLAHQTRSALELVRQAQRPFARVPDKVARTTGDARARAIAELDAARALHVRSAYGRTVDDFRRAYLRDFLAPGDPVYDWLERTSQSEGQDFTQWVTVKLPRGHKWTLLPGSQDYGIVLDPPIVLGKGKAAAEELIELTMLVPDRYTGVTQIRIVEGGVLDDLRLLSTRIAREVGWTEWEAVGFVLTGIAPAVPLVDPQMRGPLLDAKARGGGRITLSVHPSTTPRELAAAYGALRRERGLTGRNLSEKHTALAAFLTARPDDSATWTQQMKRWNTNMTKDHKSWRYMDADHFARDAKQARRRMEERDGKTRAG